MHDFRSSFPTPAAIRDGFRNLDHRAADIAGYPLLIPRFLEGVCIHSSHKGAGKPRGGSVAPHTGQ